MKIKIQGFRCNIDNDYEFENGKLTLLKGESGIGKSTIFQAIYWCLYGSLRNIKSNTCNIKRSNVILEFDEYNLIINRINNPCLLTVIYNNQKYENEIAQDIIKSYFGTKEVWKACCYIEQGEKCSFLSMNNSEKMEFLNMISFNMDNPENYIEKVENKIKEYQNIFTDFNSKYTFNYDRLCKMNYYQDITQTIEDLQNELLNLDKLKDEIYTKVLNNNKSKGIKETFEQDLIKRRKFIKIYDDKLLEDKQKILEEKEKTLTKMNESTNKKQQYLYFLNIYNKKQELQKKLNTYPKFDDMYKDITENLYYETINQRNKYNKFIEKCNIFKITLEFLNKEKEQAKKILEYNKLITEINRVKTFLIVIPEFNEDDIKINQDNLNNLNTELKTKNDYYDEQIKFKNEELKTYNDNITQQRNKVEELNIKLNNKLKILYDEIVKLENDIKREYSIEKNNVTNTYNNESYQLNLRLNELNNVILCPHCNGGLKINNGCIIKSTENIADKDIILNLISKSKEDYQLNLTNLDDRYNSDLNKLKERYLLESKTINEEFQDLLTKEKTSLNELIKIYNNIISKDINNETKIIRNKIYNIENELKKLYDTKMKIANMKEQNIKVENELSRLKKLIDDLDIDATKELYDVSKCNEILQLQYVDMPKLDEKIIKQKLEYNNILKEYNSLQDIDEKFLCIDFENINLEDIDKIKKDIDTLKLDIQNLLKNKYEYEENIKNITELESKLKSIFIDNNIENEYNLIIQKINKINEDILKAKQNLEYTNLYNETNLYFQQREQYNTVLTYYNEFKKICIETEIQQLEISINTINNVLNQILINLFDSPINISIQFFKELKTDKRIKTQINMLLNYKGVEYDNINQLSGGEVDRISLALTLAFNFVFNSSFLLLDECMSSLNENFRNLCLKELKKFNKTIIAVNHEDIEGYYDNVIRLD